jgi:hypothetical protein
MYYFLASYIYVAWRLLCHNMAVDFEKVPPRYGVKFGLRSVLMNVTIAAVLLGVASALTKAAK